MDSFFLDANIISPFKVARRGDEGLADVVDTCVICCNRTILTGLQCNHRFCYPCWDSYLTTKVGEWKSETRSRDEFDQNSNYKLLST